MGNGSCAERQPLDLEGLRKLCKKASKAPWMVGELRDEKGVFGHEIRAQNSSIICDTYAEVSRSVR